MRLFVLYLVKHPLLRGTNLIISVASQNLTERMQLHLANFLHYTEKGGKNKGRKIKIKECGTRKR